MSLLDQILKKIEGSLYRGFIDKNKPVSSQFKPKLLTNKSHDNVLTALLQEMKTCKSFTFSVAFITEGGLATIKTMLLDLKAKGIKGRILTSTFLNFNNPKMFSELLKLENVEVRLTDVKGFHSKGYIFEHDQHYSLIVGSSNLTDSALKSNFEWNVFLTSMENGEVINLFNTQFDEAWQHAMPLNEEWILQYKANYVKPTLASKVAAPPLYVTNALKESLMIQPNKMQQAALTQLELLRNSEQSKGLIISATGTGKTYLSAFDVRNAAPKRMLFIVHREQILKKAMHDYKKILLGEEEDYGLLSGNQKDLNARYLFATVQTISKDTYMQQFAKDHFDYILIDEVHRAGADSYLKIINYFEPKFLLGMTATPERSDNYNLYELFDYNVAYEIRLQEALEEEMLCPFHYFGVTDFVRDGELIDETAELQKLVHHERVDHIIEKIQYYGYSGEKLRGLMFCSKKDEAHTLSKLLNLRGFRTLALTGDNTQEEREAAIAKLNAGELQYILTVDIFNEGIDIPFLNQIVMLRQTQSSIIFIQQLGRGLRLHDEKDYVTIIDFIGNYKNNYMIPMALSGDKSMNKDNIRRKTVNANYIQGVSTVNFEEIAKKQIFNAITDSSLSTLKILKENFAEVKNRIGRLPMLIDFMDQQSIDPEIIIDKFDNYYNFLVKMKENPYTFTDYETKVLSMLSKEFINGKRAHELILLQLLLNTAVVTKSQWIDALLEYGTYVNNETLQSVERLLTLQFQVQNDKKKYGEIPFVLFNDNEISFNKEIKHSINNLDFKAYIHDIIQCGLRKNKDYDVTQPLTINQKYSRRDFCRLMNWESDHSSTIYGYKTSFNTTPLFVTYHKKDDAESTINYGDEFLAPDLFRWFSKHTRNLTSKDVQLVVNHVNINNDLYLFVKKDDGEGSDFYYLGQTTVVDGSAVDDTMPDGRPVVTMNMILKEPVQPDIYHYLVEE